ncbi:MAG: PEP-CTERM sorting domain-containing protein [Candidatus Thiodiazotropha sp. (ex Monitilora ramsayi)]|nr:PEP-CTERM sorting domain-containing protein [Candidatus Thiodiazotropha sp. (ex Monitilora ramsayi)]
MKKVVFLLICLFAASANATLIGDTVHIAQNYPVLGSEHYPTDVTIGAGLEFDWVYDIDISADAIDIVLNGGFVNVPDALPSFNGPVISGLDDSSGNPLIGFSNFSTTISGFLASDIHIFDNNTIGFNLDGLSGYNATLHVDLDFGSTSVPEPASIALLGLGLIGIGYSKKRKFV